MWWVHSGSLFSRWTRCRAGHCVLGRCGAVCRGPGTRDCWPSRPGVRPAGTWSLGGLGRERKVGSQVGHGARAELRPLSPGWRRWRGQRRITPLLCSATPSVAGRPPLRDQGLHPFLVDPDGAGRVPGRVGATTRHTGGSGGQTPGLRVSLPATHPADLLGSPAAADLMAIALASRAAPRERDHQADWVPQEGCCDVVRGSFPPGTRPSLRSVSAVSVGHFSPLTATTCRVPGELAYMQGRYIKLERV